MIQAQIEDRRLRAQLLTLAPDGASLFTLAGEGGPPGGEARGVLVHGTRMVNDVRANHRLGPVETILLGRAYLAAALVGATMKGEDRIAIRIQGDGPAEGLSVEGRAVEAAPSREGRPPQEGRAGVEVRGYLFRSPIPCAEAPAEAELGRLFGTGSLAVTRFIAGAPRPFTGTVAMRGGHFAEELAAYYLESEQTRTAFRLSVRLDEEGRAIGAGGAFVQALPGSRDEFIARVEAALLGLPSLGSWFAEKGDAPSLLASAFGELGLAIREQRTIRFFCPCERGRFSSFLAAASPDFLRELATEGPWPVELRCHNCGTVYPFERAELAALLAAREAGR